MEICWPEQEQLLYKAGSVNSQRRSGLTIIQGEDAAREEKKTPTLMNFFAQFITLDVISFPIPERSWLDKHLSVKFTC